MTGQRSFLSWLFNLQPPPPATRLNEAEAIALAKTSPQVIALGRDLSFAAPGNRPDGKVIWHVTSGGMGAQWWVEIDDATGLVGEVQHFSGR